MKLRKWIPAAVAVLLAVILTVGLFVYAVPKAMAVDQIESFSDWALVESGYIRGMDHAICPYTCTLRFQTGLNAYSSTDTNWTNPIPVVTVGTTLEVWNKSIDEFPAVRDCGVSLEIYMYIPELDTYETKSFWNGYIDGQNTRCSAGGVDLQVCTEVDEQVYAGELIRATAKYYLLGREVATLSWYADVEADS